MTENETKRELRWIHLKDATRPEGELPIADAPFPPREEAEISDLISSVRIHGVLSPILFRVVDNHYQVVCGWRRFCAAKEAGLMEVPAFVMDLGDAAAIRCYLSGKALRRPLTTEQQNETLRVLKDLRDGTREEGVSPSTKASPQSIRRGTLQGRPLDLEAQLNECLAEVSAEGGNRPGRRVIGARQGLEGRVLSAEADGEPFARQLLARSEALFETIQRNRTIPVERTESLIDDLLLLLDGPAPVDLRILVTRTLTDFVPTHALLTAALCAHVGRGLGWNRESYRSFVVAGLLHDVGMVFVPTHSLTKPRALTDEERTELQCHTRIGCALIAGTRAWGEDVAICARDHHERWDGSGYPSAQKGSQVAFPARLMGLLDTYAAMLTPRPHRDALQPHRVLERLRSALELGLYDPSFLFLLNRTLTGAPVKGIQSDDTPAAPVPEGNSVELGDGLATMLSTDSEQYT